MMQQKKMLVSALGLVAIDFAYLSVIKGHFARQIAAVQGSPMTVNLFGAVVTYVFLIFGLNYFIIRPGRPAGDAFGLGDRLLDGLDRVAVVRGRGDVVAELELRPVVSDRADPPDATVTGLELGEVQLPHLVRA